VEALFSPPFSRTLERLLPLHRRILDVLYLSSFFFPPVRETVPLFVVGCGQPIRPLSCDSSPLFRSGTEGLECWRGKMGPPFLSEEIPPFLSYNVYLAPCRVEALKGPPFLSEERTRAPTPVP